MRTNKGEIHAQRRAKRLEREINEITHRGYNADGSEDMGILEVRENSRFDEKYRQLKAIRGK